MTTSPEVRGVGSSNVQRQSKPVRNKRRQSTRWTQPVFVIFFSQHDPLAWVLAKFVLPDAERELHLQLAAGVVTPWQSPKRARKYHIGGGGAYCIEI